MLFVPAPQVVLLKYWRDAPPAPSYERAVTEPLDVILNTVPDDSWRDELGPAGYFGWTRRLAAAGVEHFEVVRLVDAVRETSQFLL